MSNYNKFRIILLDLVKKNLARSSKFRSWTESATSSEAKNKIHTQEREKEEWRSFGIGDLVSRDGTDEHIIFDINPAGDLIGVRCTKEPALYPGASEPWTKKGEEEHNCAWRYSLVMKHINIETTDKGK